MKNKNVIEALKAEVNRHNKYYTEVEPKASLRVQFSVENGSAKVSAGSSIQGKVHHWAYEAGKAAWGSVIKDIFKDYAGRSQSGNKVFISEHDKYFHVSLMVSGKSGHEYRALEVKIAPGGETGEDKANPVMVAEYKPTDHFGDKKASKAMNFKDAYNVESNAKLKKRAEEILNPLIEKCLANAEKYLERQAAKFSEVSVRF
jgi:hypothetical protein